MQALDRGALAALAPPVLVAAAIAYVVYVAVYNVCFHPLSKFPGPVLARATPLWKAYTECVANRSFAHVLVQLHARYGEMARLLSSAA